MVEYDEPRYNVEEVKAKVIDMAFELAKEYNLPLRGVEFLRTDFFYGLATPENDIKIKVQFYDGELVPEMEIYRTLAHELAHLKHRNHQEDFWRLNRDIVRRINEKYNMKIRPEIALIDIRKGKEGVIS